jgi:uncharacterized protein YcnI
MLAVLATSAASAHAHVTVKADNPSAGSYTTLTFSLPHGCDGKPTTKAAIQMPDGMTRFVPGRTPFWASAVTMKKLDKPVKGMHGEEIAEVVDTVTYTATTPLPDDKVDTLYGSAALPPTEGHVEFPVIQTCEGGATNEWTQSTKDADTEPEFPAPMLMLAAAIDEHAHDQHTPTSTSGTDEAKHAKAMKKLEDQVDTAQRYALVAAVIALGALVFGIVAVRRR